MDAIDLITVNVVDINTIIVDSDRVAIDKDRLAIGGEDKHFLLVSEKSHDFRVSHFFVSFDVVGGNDNLMIHAKQINIPLGLVPH